LCQLPKLTAQDGEEQLAIFAEKEAEITETVLLLEQKLSVADAAVNQFDSAYQLVVKLVGEVTRSEAWQAARDELKAWPSQSYQAQKAESLQLQLNELEQRFFEQKAAEELLSQFCKRIGRKVDYEELDELKQTLEATLDENALVAGESSEKRITIRQELEQIQIKIAEQNQQSKKLMKLKLN